MTDKIATDLEEINGLFYEPNEDTPFTGSYQISHSNGQKKSEVNYKDGQQIGSVTERSDSVITVKKGMFSWLTGK
ncbi:MAG: hypothetical protein WCL34_14540 [Methylococcaceae bacterium]